MGDATNKQISVFNTDHRTLVSIERDRRTNVVDLKPKKIKRFFEEPRIQTEVHQSVKLQFPTVVIFFREKMFGEIGFDREFNDFKSSYTLPNNLLSEHPNLLAPLQSLIRKQRSAASGLNIVTTKNPISFKDSNTKNLFQRFGLLSQ